MTADAVIVRHAVEADVTSIRDIFLAIYGEDYPYQQFYDTTWLKKSIFNDEVLTLVAETADGVVGTASVVFSAGARSDFVGEFGRLAVHPDVRGHGIGRTLMEHRIAFAKRRLHAGIIENRTVHPYSQKIALRHNFATVGFLPLKHKFSDGTRESIAMFLRHFGPALELRSNHPRVVPEAHTLAHMALTNCGLKDDIIVDDGALPYPHDEHFSVARFEADSMASLLRIERGRIHHREIFGPVRLHYGFFKLEDRNASYLIARDGKEGPMVGAIGYLYDDFEKGIRVSELITRSDRAPRFLFEQLVEEARNLGVEYIEVDVSTNAPRMQRTLVELGFNPCAYVPALVFDEVERIDVVKMIRLLVKPDIGEPVLVEEMRGIAEVVMAPFRDQWVLPEVEDALDNVHLFNGLRPEQRRIVAALAELHALDAGQTLFAEGEPADQMYVILDGEVSVRTCGGEVGTVGVGDSLGEISMLIGDPHSAVALTKSSSKVVSLSKSDLQRVIRRHPDIGLVLYRNLAVGLGGKLRGLNAAISEQL